MGIRNIGLFDATYMEEYDTQPEISSTSCQHHLYVVQL
jgi:hypothetical protein